MLPEITEHECTGCGARVKGLFARWSCITCGTSSPYREPPAHYAESLVNSPARRIARPHPVCGEVHCVCPRLEYPPRG
ncbi:hypothetical protein ACFVIM_10960 [Streptomyces sp. NPDC057638]|uniref:hypothetical protein n=1 Tax=Streptomyces sp. NPDC057638 TaxID=3346190 RepID=UPI0036B6052B